LRANVGQQKDALGQQEDVDEKVSLSDRFGLWIGFHNCSQDDYLDMVRSYAAHYRLPIADEALTREALAWALGRGARSGRVAFQYIQDLAGRLGVRLDGD
jgi:predicted AAA+ superfamily ATPase